MAKVTEELLKKTGLDTLVIALSENQSHWHMRPEAVGLFETVCELAARLAAYDDMLRASARLAVLSCELQSPVLLNQAREIYERFQVENEVRPLFKSIPKSEVN